MQQGLYTNARGPIKTSWCIKNYYIRVHADSCPDHTGKDGGGNSSRGKRYDTKESSCTETWEVTSIAVHENDPPTSVIPVQNSLLGVVVVGW